jgi:inorganic triphosphatase YgiF
MALERELKFSLLDSPPPAEELRAALDGTPFALESLGTHIQHDRYVDDASGTLHRAGVALLCRRCFDAEGAALKRLGKVTGALHERDELEAAVPASGAWPAVIVEALADAVGGDVLARVRTVVELDTERTAYAISQAGRRVALLLFDDVTARHPGSERSAHFREAELEAVGEVALETLLDLASRFADVVVLTPSSVTKLQRAEAVLSVGDAL